MRKKTYNFDPETGEYKGIKLAQKHNEEFLLPTNCTWVEPPEETKDKRPFWDGEKWELRDSRNKPPETKENEKAVWIEDHWEIRPDYVNKVFYHKETREDYLVEELGEEPGEEYTDMPPLPHSVWNEERGLWEFSYEVWLNEHVRPRRDSLMKDTDFLLMPDYPISDSDIEEVKEYRRKLRDITDTISLENPNFPDEPEVLKKMRKKRGEI
jgi:hypothetical protein